ncbi:MULTISPECIES: hypothetical protein [Burkholderia]|uniref:hypothetical protein n=1 Tax=Burkholderia TaxID=32008 RepID=UPI00075AF7F8|nr:MULTISPECIES: hypothetical protein [Burkholderia]AOJ71383.1 hypothetical protein WS78_21335 [Burkholderia savannae]AOK49780.1 hypothetical protein WT60_23145 [Burkholderia sp. MSMB617WGS]KVG49197.1 hypothetical protein WS77_26425 [Burkholderia sp. MSMB0265]KVG81883.1 hypothetical protein WS81_10920 [Burkholderia sp. MSMB2040]KVG92398.1 hypothetical protein WS82_11385 [Burkholderia sp. MSMB2041]
MNYQINISISNTGLNTIYQNGLHVTLVKSVISDPLQQGNLPIAWVTFQPLQLNQISWQEQYTMYATTTVLQAGATIMMTSQTGAPIQTGWTYTFERAQFTGADGGSPSTFNLLNSQAGNFSFGLAQQAVVNNVPVAAPLNAVPVAYNMRASFTPIENLSLFLASYSNNGSVISQVASNALPITLSTQNPAAQVGFNERTNTFYLQQPAVLSGEEFVEGLRGAVTGSESYGTLRRIV